MNAALDDLLLPASPLPAPPARRERILQIAPVPQRRRPKLLYALVAVLGALGIVAAQMGLSIATTQASYDVAELSQQQRQLTWQKQELVDALAGLSSPQYLAANAAALGMVIDASPTYLRLSDGAVFGTGDAAGWYSTVDAAARGAVGNTLVTGVPLVTAPDATIQGVPVEAEPLTGDTLPPPITDGLPTPNTR